MPRKLIEIDCTLEHETEKAVKVTTDVKADVWVPKTLCGFEKDDPDAETPCKGTITLNELIAARRTIQIKACVGRVSGLPSRFERLPS